MIRTGVRRPAKLTVLRRRRLARTIVAALMGVSTAGFLAGHAVAGTNSATARPEKASVYVVRPGDTIWAIAQRLAGRGADPRPMVDALIAINHVSGGSITPGERLAVPSPSTTG